MAEAGIGSPINNKVVEQINKRRAIIGKQSNKTNNDLRFILGNTAWVKLSSGVNTLTEEEVKTLRKQQQRTKITGENSLAKNNVLLGGLLSPNSGMRGGIDAVNTPNPNAAYRNNPKSYGIRPMPGITGMTIASKNTFGTLREAVINISVWTLEDFETIERLYLRPGFTMLLEWGHSIYLQNDGSLQKTVKTVSPEIFFYSKVTFSRLTKEIQALRKSSDNNYEAMIGYVKNFSWDYKPTGEYECTVTIISTGEILESLKPRIHPTHRALSIEDYKKITDKETREIAKKSPIHFFGEIMKEATEPFEFVKSSSKLGAEYPSFFSNLNDFPNFFANIDYSTAGSWIGQLLSKDEVLPTNWIPLSAVLEIFTKNLTIVNQGEDEKSVDRYTPPLFFEAQSNPNKYLTFPEHFSINPAVCVLPKKVGGDFLSTLGKDNTTAHVEVILDNLNKANFKGGDDNILNILVSVPFVVSVVDQALDEKSQFTKSVIDILQEILGEINSSLGGVNDLDLTYDEEFEGGFYFVIDRNNTPTNGKLSPEFTMAGIDSVFTNVNISSKITNQIASQIGIAAQGSTQNFSENVENLLRWNPSVVDRVITSKGTANKDKNGNTEIVKEEKERVEDWIESVITYFEAFNGDGWRDDQKQAARTLFDEQMAKYVINNKKIKKEPIPGLIPVELSFTMDGIGGLKIGETFRIAPGILPRKYQDKFGYIITGLDHSVGSNGRWETNVKTQFYLIESTSKDEATSSAKYETSTASKSTASKSTASKSTAPASTSTIVNSLRTKDIPVVKYLIGKNQKNGMLDSKYLRNLNIPDDPTSNKIHRLFPTAATQWEKLIVEARKAGFKINETNISYLSGAAYRPPTRNNSVHGWGCAVDIQNLVTAQGGPESYYNVAAAKKVRETNKFYIWLNSNAAKFGWVNPSYMKDGVGVEEAWHWEYHGPVDI